MEGEEIGVVLARASELREKINQCIVRNCGGGGGHRGGEVVSGVEPTAAEEAEEEEAESLFNIRDALDSLERQLSALQGLQQQQMYERDSILVQIDRSRMILLSKLKEYKGEDLEVIHEAAAFAGETIDHYDSLVLPPYPSHVPDMFVLDDFYPSSNFAAKFAQNGSVTNSKYESERNTSEKEKNQNANRSKGVRHFFGLVAKSVITFVSVMSVLSFAGYHPRPKQWAVQFKAIPLLRRQVIEEKQGNIQCPPGKVLVIEGGEARCLVKERVEVPFESDVSTPNISYGLG